MPDEIDTCHGWTTRKNAIPASEFALVRWTGFAPDQWTGASKTIEFARGVSLILKPKLTAPAKARDMKLHRLPWPKDELAALGDAQVELRVDLVVFRRA